jgi:hypothetical protein
LLSTLVPSTLVPWHLMRSPTAMLLRLSVPCLAIWLAIQVELLRGPSTIVPQYRDPVPVPEYNASA